MEKIYKVTLNGQTIQITKILREALALALNSYQATNMPLNIEVTENDKIIVNFFRFCSNE